MGDFHLRLMECRSLAWCSLSFVIFGLRLLASSETLEGRFWYEPSHFTLLLNDALQVAIHKWLVEW